ncbi:hypothetical protein U737_19415 [Methylomonas sp. LW13]|uniref:hypothetical protein n=1 Tax=unclassified Methylomonas TaxID=2608980 RepID=UPI00051C93BC|nr:MULTISPECIES: hypothetical protein [unclassified Methylomonas]PKD38376.1 hypothetical protein CWO84_19170 [Methylomonas sp. Kb3]QBC28898.1 hypothetical protein U737_19415 [Methylomonas sp. LW13]
MGHLGMLALGVFIGSLICIAVRKTTNWSDAAKVVVALIGAALSGTVFTFIEKILGTSLGAAMFMYPVGLAWSLVWLYADQSIEHIKSTDSNQRTAGWLHIAGIILGTIFVLLLLLSESFRALLPK